MKKSGGQRDRSMAAMRRTNVATCIQVMRDQGTETLTELARVTGLSRTTVESILDELTSIGLVRPRATAATGPGAGRPARQFEFRPDHRYVLGVDIGLHTIRALLVNLAGEVTHLAETKVASGISARDRVESIRGAMRQLLRDAQLPDHQVFTAVAAVPGIIAPDGTVLLSNPVPEWSGVNLSALLSDGFGFPVVIENDVNMAALAEHAAGASQLVDDVVYVHLGHRMSAALIINGELYRGKHYAAGEVANLAGTGWAERKDGEIRVPSKFGDRTAHGVMLAARDGDPEAILLVGQLAETIAPGVANLGAALDPDLIVIGGGLSQGGETLLAPLRLAVAKEFANRDAPQLVTSELGARASAIGASVRGLQIVSLGLYQAAEPSIPRIGLPGTGGSTAGPASGGQSATQHEGVDHVS